VGGNVKPRIFVPVILLAACAVAPVEAQDRLPEENPRITLRIPDDAVFHRTDRVPVAFRPEEDGYVTIFRIDTDGRLRILYPARPGDDNHVWGGTEYRVPNPYGYAVEHTFAIDDYPGIGYLFAVLSRDPYDYQPYALHERWEYRTVGSAGRVTGDPYVAVSEVLERMLPPGTTGYGFDALPYYVEARYEYPRFVCYDCHAYVAYPVWDPYRYWCATFQVVIYDYPVWYPGTLYPATQVVVGGGARVQPQYLIKARTQTDPQVVHVTRRGTPQAADGGVRGRDLGGIGSVPAPRKTSEQGGIGGVLRRLFGGADEGSSRRPIAPGAVAPTPTAPEKQPQLERRIKRRKPDGEAGPPAGPGTEGRRPGSGASRTPTARPAPAVQPTTPAQRPTAEPAANPGARRTGPKASPPSTSARRRGW
jgi:hypothetical protein